MASIHVSDTGNPSHMCMYVRRDGIDCTSHALRATGCLISFNTLKSLYVFCDVRTRPTGVVTS